MKLHDVDSQQQQPTQLQTFDAEALRDVDTEKIQYEITIIEEQLNRMKPNMAAILEYKRKVERLFYLLIDTAASSVHGSYLSGVLWSRLCNSIRM